MHGLISGLTGPRIRTNLFPVPMVEETPNGLIGTVHCYRASGQVDLRDASDSLLRMYKSSIEDVNQIVRFPVVMLALVSFLSNLAVEAILLATSGGTF